MNKFYVYVYLDPRKPGTYKYNEFEFTHQPFYIGKGKGYRCYVGLKNDNQVYKVKYNKIQSIISSGNIPIVIKLYENLTEEESLKIEVELISKIGKIINKNGPLVNITDGGDGGNGFKHTNEWKKVLSKPIIQLSLDDILIKEFNSIKEASVETNIHKQNIGACANGKYKTAGGYKWVYKNNESKLQSHLSSTVKMPKHTDETKKKLKKKRNQDTIDKLRKVKARPIIQYNINGKFIKEFSSSKEAERELNIGNSGISMCCNQKINSFGGFIWKHKVGEIELNIDITNIKLRKRIILQYSIDNELISEWASIREAELSLNLPKGYIQRCCNNKLKTCGGFIWRYKST